MARLGQCKNKISSMNRLVISVWISLDISCMCVSYTESYKALSLTLINTIIKDNAWKWYNYYYHSILLFLHFVSDVSVFNQLFLSPQYLHHHSFCSLACLPSLWLHRGFVHRFIPVVIWPVSVVLWIVPREQMLVSISRPTKQKQVREWRKHLHTSD